MRLLFFKLHYKKKQNTHPKTYINMIAHTYTNAMWQLTQLSAPAAWIKIDALQRNHRAQLSCEGKAALTLLCN